jgi:GNAT superfamily N-acetyltransferase
MQTVMTWINRDARPDDWPVIADFNRRMALESEAKVLDPATVAAGVQRVLADPALGRYFVAESDHQVIGQLMITLEWSDWRNATFWWLQSVYVAERWRGQGVFRGLYQHVESLARASQTVCGIRLYMDEHNARANRAYEALGIRRGNYLLLEKELPAGPAADPS